MIYTVKNRVESPYGHIDIYYEDNHLLVVDKPVNMPVVRDYTGDTDLQSRLKEWLAEVYNKPGNVYLSVVHRLDRPVSGLMVLAKTSKAASRLADQIRRRIFQKTYLAVVDGVCPHSGELVHYLIKDPEKNRTFVTSPVHPEARKAILRYRRLEATDEHSMVEIDLITGRPHQIRVQFSEEGHPLWGDHKYGVGNLHGTTPALRATGLCFQHPVSGEILDFRMERPNEDQEPWNYFRR